MNDASKMMAPSGLKRTVVTLALGLLMLAPMATSASADPDHGRHGYGNGRGYDRDWRGHEAHARGYWRHPYRDPHIIYAPPAIYAPPPMEQSPGLNLVFPLNFR